MQLVESEAGIQTQVFLIPVPWVLFTTRGKLVLSLDTRMIEETLYLETVHQLI